MRLSDFYTMIRSVRSDAHEFGIQLAQADPTPGDDVDVQLSDIGWVELDYEAGQARLFPRSAVTENSPDQAIPTLEMLLQLLPLDDTGDSNLVIVAELPLNREGPGPIQTALEAIQTVHVGCESKEAWLLVGTTEDFGDEVLPA